MPRFSANISMLFAERDWLDRPAAAAAAGFAAVEIQFPYDRPAEDWQRAIEEAGLAVSVVNLPVGDMLAGGPGLAATPGRQAGVSRGGGDGARRRGGAPAGQRQRAAGLPGTARARARALPRHLGGEFAPRGGRHGRDRRRNDGRGGQHGRPAGLPAVDQRTGARRHRPDRPRQPRARARPLSHGHHGRPADRAAGGDRAAHRPCPSSPTIPAVTSPAPGRSIFPAVFAALDRLGYDGWTAAEYVPSRTTEETLGWMTGTG